MALRAGFSFARRVGRTLRDTSLATGLARSDPGPLGVRMKTRHRHPSPARASGPRSLRRHGDPTLRADLPPPTRSVARGLRRHGRSHPRGGLNTPLPERLEAVGYAARSTRCARIRTAASRSSSPSRASTRGAPVTGASFTALNRNASRSSSSPSVTAARSTPASARFCAEFAGAPHVTFRERSPIGSALLTYTLR